MRGWTIQTNLIRVVGLVMTERIVPHVFNVEKRFIFGGFNFLDENLMTFHDLHSGIYIKLYTNAKKLTFRFYTTFCVYDSNIYEHQIRQTWKTNVKCNNQNRRIKWTLVSTTIYMKLWTKSMLVHTILFTERANIGDWTAEREREFSVLAMIMRVWVFSLYRDCSQWSWMLSSSWRKNRLGYSRQRVCIFWHFVSFFGVLFWVI